MSDEKSANRSGQIAPQGAQGGQPNMGGQEGRTGQGRQGGMNSQNTWPNDPSGKGKDGTPKGQEKEAVEEDDDSDITSAEE